MKAFLIVALLSLLLLTSCGESGIGNSRVTPETAKYYNADIESQRRTAFQRLDRYSSEFQVRHLLLGHNAYIVAGVVVALTKEKTDEELKTIGNRIQMSIPGMKKPNTTIYFFLNEAFFALGHKGLDSSDGDQEKAEFKIFDRAVCIDRFIGKLPEKDGKKPAKVFLQVRHQYPNIDVFYPGEREEMIIKTSPHVEGEYVPCEEKEWGYLVENTIVNTGGARANISYFRMAEKIYGKMNDYYATPGTGRFRYMLIDITEEVLESQ